LAQLSAFVLRYEHGVTAGFALTRIASFTGTVALTALQVASKATFSNSDKDCILRSGAVVNLKMTPSEC
jgi:hypothetical protein